MTMLIDFFICLCPLGLASLSSWILILHVCRKWPIVDSLPFSVWIVTCKWTVNKMFSFEITQINFLVMSSWLLTFFLNFCFLGVSSFHFRKERLNLGGSVTICNHRTSYCKWKNSSKRLWTSRKEERIDGALRMLPQKRAWKFRDDYKAGRDLQD